MSPRLETDADRERQRLVGEHIAALFDWECHHMPDLHPYDFRFYADGQCVVLAELKGRDDPALRFPSWFAARAKIDALTRWRSRSPLIYDVAPVGAFFIFRFNDGSLKWVDIDHLVGIPLEPMNRHKPRSSGLVGLHDKKELGYYVPNDLLEPL